MLDSLHGTVITSAKGFELHIDVIGNFNKEKADLVQDERPFLNLSESQMHRLEKVCADEALKEVKLMLRNL